MDFDAYSLDDSIFDEVFHPDGLPREQCSQLYQALRELSVEEITTIQERVTRSFSNEGITFTVYGDDEAEERIIPIDCLPRIVPASDWGKRLRVVWFSALRRLTCSWKMCTGRHGLKTSTENLGLSMME